ncbi:MAG: hypothetical protein EON53_07075 [Actinomycetales bacterium]|nr:MAG: hypothetical protein EON53_07075 [Actinomycetales bacterium]
MNAVVAMPIGRALVRAGVITPEQAADAVAAQRAEGGLIGQHLILAGAVTRREMYAALAKQWRAPMIDLVAEPPDPALVVGEPHQVIARGWVPCTREEDVVVVATSLPPTGERLLEMRATTGASTVLLRTATDWDVFQAVARVRREQLADTRLPGEEVEGGSSASRTDRLVRRLVGPVLVLGVLVVALVARPGWVLLGLLAATNLVLLAGFTVLLALSRRTPRALAEVGEAAPPVPPDAELPRYTVLVPGPSGTAWSGPALLEHLDRIDYPRTKLEVLMLVDEHDRTALEAMKAARPPSYVTILEVPRGLDGVDAESFNYGLAFARGRYVVTYLAGDQPEPHQLRASVDAFAADDSRDRDTGRRRLVCVQATISYANAEANVLTRISAVEHAAWSAGVLPAADAWGIAAPLRGPSHHFDTQELRALGAWDPEDRDEGAGLALRVAAARRRVEVMTSTTTTVAADRLGPWVEERTGWIVGCVLTTSAQWRRGRRGRLPAGTVAGTALLAVSPLGFLALPLALAVMATGAITATMVDTTISGELLLAQLVWILVVFTVAAVLSGRATSHLYGWRTVVGASAAPLSWCLHVWAAARALLRLARRTPSGQ